MAKYRHRLPQLEGGLFLTDGGLETTLIFHKGVELPHFAAFDLLRSIEGREMLRDYHVPYIEAARINGYGFILDGADVARQSRLGRRSSATRKKLSPPSIATPMDADAGVARRL